MEQLAKEGVGVILISSELPEILGITDRVVVLHEGELAATLETSKTNQEEILSYDVSDESLETAATSKAGAYTLGFCTGLSACPA